MSTDPQPLDNASYKEAIEAMKEAHLLALRASKNIDLTKTERRNAGRIADTLSQEIGRAAIAGMNDLTAEYEDAADVMPKLIQPLRDAKERAEDIAATLHDVNKVLAVLDRALAVALKFAL